MAASRHWADLFFKVEVLVDEGEQPERLAEEIRRVILKVYGVRKVEVSSIVTAGEGSPG